MHDVIIIGAGPAGLAAGIYCGRFKLRTKIIERQNFGGLVNLTDRIENYPGVYNTSSKDLIDTMVKQCRDLETLELEEYKEVYFLGKKEGNFEIGVKSLTDDKETKYNCASVIIATGSLPKRLGVIGEEKFIGKGVSYCAICDAPFFKGKDIIVVGGGDTALEETLYLAKFASNVYVVHRRPQLRASKILEDRAKALNNIKLVLGFVCEEIKGSNKVESVSIKNVATGKIQDISCSGIFIFVGYSPNTKFLKEIEMTKDGWVITDDKLMTNLPGAFVCGDCRDKGLRQIVTACGEGATAAFNCFNYIKSFREEI